MAITKVQSAVTPPVVSTSTTSAGNAVAPAAPAAVAQQPADTFKSGTQSAAPVTTAPPVAQAQPSMTRPFADKPALSSDGIDYTAVRKLSPPTDAQTAVVNADLILRGPDTGDAPSTGMSAHTFHSRLPPPVNSPDDNDPHSDRYLTAQAQVQQNAPLEQSAVAKLSTLNQGKYQTLKDTLSQDPVAQLALQKVLFSGGFPGQMDVHGTGTLIENLNKLATTASLAPSINRNTLLADTVQEIATPSSIHQGGADTCGATSAAIQLAMQNPSEYARIVTGLAGPEGKVTLTGNDNETDAKGILRRVPGTEVDDGSGRTVSQRLLAPALMDYADGSAQKYTLGTGQAGSGDRHRAALSGGQDQQPGLYADQDARLQTAIQKRAFVPFPPQRGMTVDGAAGMQKLQQLVAAGNSVNATIVVGGQGTSALHTVCVTGVDPSGPPAGWVNFVNPWGREERMPIPEFQHRMDSLTYPQDALPADLAPVASNPQPPSTVSALTRGTVTG